MFMTNSGERLSSTSPRGGPTYRVSNLWHALHLLVKIVSPAAARAASTSPTATARTGPIPFSSSSSVKLVPAVALVPTFSLPPPPPPLHAARSRVDVNRRVRAILFMVEHSSWRCPQEAARWDVIGSDRRRRSLRKSIPVRPGCRPTGGEMGRVAHAHSPADRARIQ